MPTREARAVRATRFERFIARMIVSRILRVYGAIIAIWVGLQIVPDPIKRETNAWLLLFVGITFMLCVLSMLAFTERWTTRGLGILGTLQGDATLYIGTGLISLGAVAPMVYSELVDLARACFIVGAPLLLRGWYRYMRERWNHRGDTTVVDPNS